MWKIKVIHVQPIVPNVLRVLISQVLPVFNHPKPLSEIHSGGCAGPNWDQPLTATDQGQGGE